LIEGRREQGVHVTRWEGLDDAGHAVGPGVYLAKLLVDGKTIGSQRIVIVQ